MKRPVFNLTRKYFISPELKAARMLSPKPQNNAQNLGLNISKAKFFGKRANSITNPQMDQ